MPRLVGKKSNNGLLAGFVLLAAVVAAGAVEYLGYVNFIPSWGKDQRTVSQATSTHLMTVIPHSKIQH